MARRSAAYAAIIGLLRGEDLFLPADLLERFISGQDGYQNVTRNMIGWELKAAGVLAAY